MKSRAEDFPERLLVIVFYNGRPQKTQHKICDVQSQKMHDVERKTGRNGKGKLEAAEQWWLGKTSKEA